jgi:uncharacterized membrane protein
MTKPAKGALINGDDLTKKKSRFIKIEGLYLFLVLALGVLYIIVLPPNSAPDEPSHFQGAYTYTNYIFGTVSDDKTLIEMRETDTDMFEYPDNPGGAVYDRYMEDLANPMAPKDELDMKSVKRNTIPVVPFDYFPQAVGILIGRLIGLGFVWTYILARLFNLLMYAFVTWFAIKKTPIGKGVFAVTALFPMSLELAGSVSYDAFIIAFAFLSIALFLKLKYGEGKVETKDIIIFLFVLMMLAPTKGVYAALFLLAFLIPKERFADAFQHRWYYIYLVIFALAGAVMTLTNFIGDLSGSSGILFPRAGDLYSLSDFLADPGQFFSLLIPTQKSLFTYYLPTMSGSMLGWLEIGMPKYIWLTCILLAFVAAFRKKDENPITVSDRVWFVSISMAMYLFIMFIFFISWTRKDAVMIEGVQGRYLTPFFPMLLLVMKMKSFSIKWLDDKWLLFICGALNGMALYLSYALIVSR